MAEHDPDEAEDLVDPRERRRRRWMLGALWLIATVIAGWALRATAPVSIPLVFSLFLALLVAPLDKWVRDRTPGWASWLGHVVAMGAILAALLVFVGCLWIAAQQVMTRFPIQGPSAGSLLSEIGQGIAGEGDEGAATDTTSGAETEGSSGAEEEGSSDRLPSIQDAADAFGTQITQWASTLATRIVTAAGVTIAALVLTFFLTMIMLIEAPEWRGKTQTLLDRRARRDELESVEIITQRLRRYLGVRTVLGVLTALLYATWLWIFGIDLLLVWALLAFLLNFIPTLGSLIAGVLPIAYALLQKDLGTVAFVAAGILVIEQVMGNYVDPRLQGQQLSISSLVVLVALLFWGWLWGIAGAILAVPITIAILIVCAHIGPLRPVALMLSAETDMEGLDRVTSRS